MSMFAKKVTQVVVVKDGEKDVNVTIRKLSAKSLAIASENRQIAAATVSRKLGPEIIRAYQDERTAKKADSAGEGRASEQPEKPTDIEAAKKARYAGYERESVLQAGVAAWDAVDAEGKPIPVNYETIADLDEVTVKTLHEAIIDLSLGPIDPAELEANRGKD